MIRILPLYAAALCLAGACATPQGSGPADLRLYVFDCGRIRFDSVAGFGVEEDETGIRQLAVPCYVIEHPRGRLLWEGGLASSLADAGGWQGGDFQMRLDRRLADQLPAVGLDLTAFDLIAFSHLHLDHVGVANEVDGAIMIIQQAEHDAVFGGVAAVPAVDVSLVSEWAAPAAPKRLIDGDHDVFGDGRVRIVFAPGHTPGHQVLFLDLAHFGPLVLSGDLYHLPISRRDRRVPQWNVDRKMTLASMERVEALVRDTGATLWIEHDLATFEKLRRAPAYYD